MLTTDPGVDQVDESEAGTIIHDPAYVTSHVLSRSGYLLKVSGSGGVADNVRLAKALTDEVSQGLQGSPPTLALPETSLGWVDICAAVRSAGLAERLGVTSPPEDSVDGRVWAYPDRFWVSFFARAAHPGSGQSATVDIGGVTAEVKPQTCDVVIPLRAAPAGAGWQHESLLARPAATGPDCAAFVRALGPLVEELGS